MSAAIDRSAHAGQSGADVRIRGLRKSFGRHEVLRGIAGSDFADVLLRAAAFARVVASGRAALSPDDPGPEVRHLLQLSEQLETAGHAELDHRLV